MDRLFVTEHDPARGAPTVVLIHGSLDRSAAFARVQRHLDDMRVLRYDRRGYGRSLALGPAASFAVQVDDLALVVGDRPAVLVGHSFGGVIALAFAQREPSLVQAVVAYESPMPWADWWPTTSAGSLAAVDAGDPGDVAERFMCRMVGDERWEALPQRTRTQRRAEGPALLADMHSVRDPRHPPYDSSRIVVPVIAARGGASTGHHVTTAERLAEALADGELVVVPGASHGVHLTHPKELAALARRALERAAASSSAPCRRAAR